jgi:hydroxymethylpyrimidine pyrophosphatase-like HAD family hydrolase
VEESGRLPMANWNIQTEVTIPLMVPAGFTKATGMEHVLNHLCIAREDSFAFGDSLNDLPMLMYTPNSIAMGAAPCCMMWQPL